MDRKNILVIDVEQNMLSIVEYILEATYRRIAAVEDGKESLKKVLAARSDDRPIHFLMTDIRVPDLTGMELVNELNQLNINIPDLIITKHGDKRLIVESMRGRKDKHHKPYDGQELIRRVITLVEKEGQD